MTLSYVWNRIMKKLQMAAIKGSSFEKPSKAEAGSTVIGTTMGRYSYCGYYCTLINCTIGRFCSLADYVTAGLSSHPIDWVSTSPAFYRGRDSIPKNLAALDYDASAPRTTIGHDVWVGQNVLIKPGITIETGAVIGMGSVVTKDVPPYTIVAGNPARVIRPRFSRELAERLLASCWWELDPDQLKQYAHLINRPEEFLNALEGRP